MNHQKINPDSCAAENCTLEGHPSTIILTIAGSDPSGGAGIQADLKTLTSLGVYSAAAISCLTVQDTRGVISYQPLPPSYIKEQVMAVLSDLPVSHIKIGMIGSGEIARMLGEILNDFSGEVIYDPVLTATGGQTLSTENLIKSIHECLLDRITVLTPNGDELALLSTRPVSSSDQALLAAQLVLERHHNLRALIVTGGHIDRNSPVITDYLIIPKSENRSSRIDKAPHPRHTNIEFHGTGCTFASAFTAFHLRTGSYEEAFVRTVQYMDRLISKSVDFKIGRGSPPLSHHKMTG